MPEQDFREQRDASQTLLPSLLVSIGTSRWLWATPLRRTRRKSLAQSAEKLMISSSTLHDSAVRPLVQKAAGQKIIRQTARPWAVTPGPSCTRWQHTTHRSLPHRCISVHALAESQLHKLSLSAGGWCLTGGALWLQRLVRGCFQVMLKKTCS